MPPNWGVIEAPENHPKNTGRTAPMKTGKIPAQNTAEAFCVVVNAPCEGARVAGSNPEAVKVLSAPIHEIQLLRFVRARARSRRREDTHRTSALATAADLRDIAHTHVHSSDSRYD